MADTNAKKSVVRESEDVLSFIREIRNSLTTAVSVKNAKNSAWAGRHSVTGPQGPLRSPYWACP